MTVVIVGELTKSEGGYLYIKDATNQEIIQTRALDDETLELDPGTTGVFMGEFQNGMPVISRYEIRKLIHPLYEEDLLGEAGKIVVSLIDDPFPELFEAKLKELEELEAYKAENPIAIPTLAQTIGTFEEGKELFESRFEDDEEENEDN